MNEAPHESVFDELKRYVGFSGGDEVALRALGPVVAPHVHAIVETFYARILQHEGARAALLGGERQVGHLKVTLREWLGQLLVGPWDHAYYERRARIGRVHVRIALPQHYMLGAMNVLRTELAMVVETSVDALQRPVTSAALSRVLDLELAIMLHTYREDLLAQHARVERLSTFGQLVGSIGHELRNPLGVIETSLFVLKGRDGHDARTTRHLDRIGDQVQLANDIITQLLDMIRDRPLQPQPIDVAVAIAAAANAVPRGPDVRLELEGWAGLPTLHADPTQLRQVVTNLVENAVHAVGASGTVRVTGAAEGPLLVLQVDDSGPGLDASVRARLFEPLVTTKARGIGLGLALVRRIAQRHGGSVSASNAPSGGARFEVRLPW